MKENADQNNSQYGHFIIIIIIIYLFNVEYFIFYAVQFSTFIPPEHTRKPPVF